MKKKPVKKESQKAGKKRAYAKPGFETAMAFERTSLACSGQKNTAGPPIGFCTMQS